MPGKPVKTETTVRTYDADDELVNETVTVSTVTTPAPPDMSMGFYL
jgi:hypothetical protein